MANAGCAPASEASAPLAIGRALTIAEVGFAPDGRSAEIGFVVPPATRSLTIVVRGDDAALYGVAAFDPPGPDGDRVGLPSGVDLAAALDASYRRERIGTLGALPQSIRLGLFTFVHPAGDEALTAGVARLRLATDRPARPVAVEIAMPRDDGAVRLPIDVYRVSRAARYRADDPASVPWLAEAARLLAAGGVVLEVGRVVNVADAGDAHVAETREPQEGPDSPAARLMARVHGLSPGRGLAVVVVDGLPPGIGGLALGTPVPPRAGTMYSGVVLEDREPGALGWFAAHEIAHALGLGHLEDRAASGAVVADPFDDTRAGDDNLMATGRALSPAQARALRRSAWLR